jgi:hypothetical protein
MSDPFFIFVFFCASTLLRSELSNPRWSDLKNIHQFSSHVVDKFDLHIESAMGILLPHIALKLSLSGM